jgi:hypothetical protein
VRLFDVLGLTHWCVDVLGIDGADMKELCIQNRSKAANESESREERPIGTCEIRHLNQAQLARRWGLSPRSLERWRWLKVGPPYLRIGGRVAYRLVDIESYEAANLHKNTEVRR